MLLSTKDLSIHERWVEAVSEPEEDKDYALDCTKKTPYIPFNDVALIPNWILLPGKKKHETTYIVD